MTDQEEDEYDYDYDDAAECDCSHAEVDILTGESYCLSCRRTRVLSSEELTRELQLQAEAYEAYVAESSIDEDRGLMSEMETIEAATRDEAFQAACQRYAHANGSSMAIMSAAKAALDRVRQKEKAPKGLTGSDERPTALGVVVGDAGDFIDIE